MRSWGESLELDETEEDRRKLRKATYGGKPLGNEEFVERMRMQAEAVRVASVGVA